MRASTQDGHAYRKPFILPGEHFASLSPSKIRRKRPSTSAKCDRLNDYRASDSDLLRPKWLLIFFTKTLFPHLLSPHANALDKAREPTLSS